MSANNTSAITKVVSDTKVVSGPIFNRSLTVAFVVGTGLSLINLRDSIWDGTINWFQAVLTYVVPFCVASHGAYSAIRVPVQSKRDGQSA